MVELIKKEDVKGAKPGMGGTEKIMSLGEKKLAAGVDKNIDKNIDKSVPSGITGNITGDIPGGTDVTPGVEVAPPDQDIKDMIAKLQGGVSGEGGVPPGGEGSVPSGLPPMDISIIKGLLYTVYRLPGVVYRVKGYKPPEEVMVDIDDQAQQLHTIMIRYGIADIKYIDLLVFGGGFAMNMANCIGVARDLKDSQLVDRERKLEADRLRMEMEEKRLREETDKVARAENVIRQRGPGE